MSKTATAIKRTADRRTILECVEIYLAYKSVSGQWGQQIKHRVGRFVAYLGGDKPFRDIDTTVANQWLLKLERQAEFSDETLHGYRAALHCVWTHAFMEGYTEVPPLRLRRIRREPKLVEAYTQVELLRLYQAAQNMRRNIQGTMIPRCIWWPAYLAAAYSTGLRKGCLLSLKHHQIDSKGVAILIAKKTRKHTTRRLCPEAFQGIKAIARYHEKDLAFPRGRSMVEFFEDFEDIKILADIEHGTSKWIRRAAVSYCEAAEVGTGRLIAGHSDDRVTDRSYRDLRIAPPPLVEPPAIDWSKAPAPKGWDD